MIITEKKNFIVAPKHTPLLAAGIIGATPYLTKYIAV
jgi:hypothetical protein